MVVSLTDSGIAQGTFGGGSRPGLLMARIRGGSQLDTFDGLIAEMRAAVPEGRSTLSPQEMSVLRRLTGQLLSCVPGAGSEYLRYLAIRRRSLAIEMETAGRWVKGSRILVTGGTGCVGSELMSRLSSLRPQRLVSVSRGVTRDWPRTAGAEYVNVDVRDRQTLEDVVAQVKPDVLLHVAAQRDPGLAEREVHRTVTTNVLGTDNVIAAAKRAAVPRVILASTGKTVIPFTTDVYASTKRVAEWLSANAAGRGEITFSAARFTHLVDNSILNQRILDGCQSGLIRLHGADSYFYVQSAIESVQLLMCAALESYPGALAVHAISDLGWPFDLLSIALGALITKESDAAIYFSGYDPGYRSNVPFPGQYDSQSSWEVSPLLNAFEARNAYMADYQHVDIFPRLPLADSRLEEQFIALQETCARTTDADVVRDELNSLVWSIFEATLDQVPAEVLLRIKKSGISRSDPEGMAHPRILAAIEDRTI